MIEFRWAVALLPLPIFIGRQELIDLSPYIQQLFKRILFVLFFMQLKNLNLPAFLFLHPR